jgi:hypothetical protein
MKLITLLALAFTLAIDLSCFAEAKTASAKGKATNLTTNLGPELEMVASVFDVTSSPVKDPFFPHTTRVPLPAATNTIAPVIDASAFALKGLSGPAGQRLALINNRTLAVGESAEITTLTGAKVKIRCLAIKENSAVILADNQSGPIELRYEEHFFKPH